MTRRSVVTNLNTVRARRRTKNYRMSEATVKVYLRKKANSRTWTWDDGIVVLMEEARDELMGAALGSFLRSESLKEFRKFFARPIRVAGKGREVFNGFLPEGTPKVVCVPLSKHFIEMYLGRDPPTTDEEMGKCINEKVGYAILVCRLSHPLYVFYIENEQVGRTGGMRKGTERDLKELYVEGIISERRYLAGISRLEGRNVPRRRRGVQAALPDDRDNGGRS